MYAILSCVVALFTTDVKADLYRDCSKLFNPHNYNDQLPSLSMPYVNNVPIKPSPVITTKVINVVTEYVYKNPVCVKVSGKKSPCRSLQPPINSLDHIVTKEIFVKDRRSKRPTDTEDGLRTYLQGSEEARAFTKQTRTPTLSSEEVRNMLIEDRLDQLEAILPNYTRRRVYQTSTITVTEVKSNNRATATLLVRNCVPQGYDLCPPKERKPPKPTNKTSEYNYFGWETRNSTDTVI